MKFIKRETEPHKLKINGNEYPAIYNFAAIKAQEDVTECSHVITTSRIVNGVHTSPDIVGVVYGMLSAAGVECSPDDIAGSIHISDENALISQILKIMIDQMPEKDEDDDSKNAKRATETAT